MSHKPILPLPHRRNGSDDEQNQYKGTIIPAVGKLIRECAQKNIKYKIITDKSFEKPLTEPLEKKLFIIKIHPITAKLLDKYWV